jgi:hypothetical protein
MPIGKQIVRDGITSESRVTVTSPRSRQQLREDEKAIRALAAEHNLLSTFDGRVASLERFCHRHSAGTRSITLGDRQLVVPIEPTFGSLSWYAASILLVIAAARAALARGDVQLAMSEAVEVGALATEAQAKFSNWADLLLREARIRKNRELGLRGRAALRTRTVERYQEFAALATRYCARYPTYSMRQLAKKIADEQDLNEGTVRHRLRKLGIRHASRHPAQA